jgi:methylase of polypeptide subunit release factors
VQQTPRTIAFGPLTISYDETVLKPRPWTFGQSDWAVDLLREAPPGPVLELCCGAGHIGLAVGALTGRDVVLVDASARACKFAQHNAVLAGLEGATDVRHALVDAALDHHERFALVLADPPYLPSASTGAFPDDPRHAVDGGADGLSLARLCMDVAARHTEPEAPVLLQLRDLPQARELAEELRDSHPLTHVESRELDVRGAVLHLRRTD